MRHLCVPEYARIPREPRDDRMWRRLQAFDEVQTRRSGKPVFDWAARKYVRALNYVGVVQVPGALVEILPKIDAIPDNDLEAWRKSRSRSLAQGNLLYMLSLTRNVPLVEKDLANLALQKMSLLDALVRLFAERLLEELKKGLDHTYVRREDNLQTFKGKLLVSPHIRHNIAHRERFHVAFDEFVADTWLNRILKACCRRLLQLTPVNLVQKRLKEVAAHLGSVADTPVQAHHFDLVAYNRNNERFAYLIDFARLVLTGQAPSPAKGAATTFSLLFPMERLFEEFVARFIWRHATKFGLERSHIHIQARGQGRWLLQDVSGHGRFQLRPDIVLTRPDGSVQTIIDTKWKRLKADIEDTRNGVLQADLYQMYAYANRYKCQNNALLFPWVPGASPKRYLIDGTRERGIGVEFIDMGTDMRKPEGRAKLMAEIAGLLACGRPEASDGVALFGSG